jgi:hypothetical protein
MKIKFVRFGEVKIDGKRYTEDLVIVGGKIELRDKQPSKKHKKRFDGHTPLSIKEMIPWECKLLIVGTGAEGLLPVMKKIYKRAEEYGVRLVVVPTPKACELLSKADLSNTNAILHVTC